MTAMTAKDQKQLADQNTTRAQRRQITIHQILSGFKPLASISNTISFMSSPKMVDRQALHHL